MEIRNLPSASLVFGLVLAAASTAVAQSQHIIVSGYRIGDDTTIRTDGLADVVSPTASLATEDSGKAFIATPPDGQKMRQWCCTGASPATNPVWTNVTASTGNITLSDDKRELAWAYVDANPEYLLVWFDYITYGLDYDLAGGTAVGNYPSSALYTNVVELASPTSEGRTFLGWKVSTNDETLEPVGGVTTFSGLTTVDGTNVTLTAQWKDQWWNVNVAFDGNGGSTPLPQTAVRYDVDGAAYSGLAEGELPRWTGYNFCGYWANGKEYWSAAGVATQAIWDIPTNVTMTAKWTFQWKDVDVTFNGNGASTLPLAKTTARYDVDGVAYSSLAAGELPQRTGYDFGGYWLNGRQYWSAAGVAAQATWDVPTNVTATAQWAVHAYAIAYTGLDDASGYATAAAYDEDLALAEPSRLGHTFAGWNVPSGLDASTARWRHDDEEWPGRSIPHAGTRFKADDDRQSRTIHIRNVNPADGTNVTLNANWEANSYTVTFDGAGADSPGTTEKEVTYGTEPGSIYKPSRSNHSFGGYWTGANGTGEKMWDEDGAWCYAASKVWAFTSNMTVHACWIASEYRSVRFHSKYGTLSFSSTDCHIGTPYGESSFPTITGYNFHEQFVGWFTAAEGGELVTADSIVPAGYDPNFTLYAHWEKARYFIAFDGNGATSGEGMAVAEFRFDMPTNLPANVYARTGYAYVGWTNALNAVTNCDGEAVENLLATAANQTNTLFAVWKANDYVLAFDPSGGTLLPGKEAPEPLTLTYDAPPVELPPNVFTHGELWTFGGWRNAWNGEIYEDGAMISNAYDVADGTNTLCAVWLFAPTDLSLAMHCYDLQWETTSEKTLDWFAFDGTGAGYDGSDSCARQTGGNQWGITDCLYAIIPTNGLLSFQWKTSRNGENDKLRISADIGESNNRVIELKASSNDVWQTSSNIVFYAGETVRIYNRGDGVTIDIDQMTWTPEGGSALQVPTFPGVATVALYGDNGWLVTLTNDVAGTLKIADNLGDVLLDLNGRDIQGGDGAPAIRIVHSSGDGAPTRLDVFDRQVDETPDILGGVNGGSGIVVAADANEGVTVSIGAGVGVAGGAGAPGQPGGAGVVGDVLRNEGEIQGGAGGLGETVWAVGGDGGKGVDGTVVRNVGTIADGLPGGGCVVVGDVAPLVYDGTEQTPAVEVVVSNVPAAYAVEVRYDGQVGMPTYLDAGDYELVVSVAASNTASTVVDVTNVTVAVTVAPKALAEGMVGEIAGQTYTGAALEPVVVLADELPSVITESDYVVVYSSNVDVGTATVTVTGCGNYTGVLTATFAIAPKALAEGMVGAIADQTYTGAALQPALGVVDADRGAALVAGTDYQAAYSNNVDVGTATATVTGRGNYTGVLTVTFAVAPKALVEGMVGAIADQTYTGAALEPPLDVVDADRGAALVAGTDYQVAYADNVNVGTATATVTGSGNYTGRVVRTFGILPTLPAALQAAFAGVGEVTSDGAGGWEVTLTNDVAGTVELPDNLGVVSLDLNGRAITGTPGAGGETGGAAIRIVSSADVGEPTQLTISDSASGVSPQVVGGAGGCGASPGDGGTGIEVAADVRDGAGVVIEEGVGVKGGDGGEGEGGTRGAAGKAVSGAVENHGDIVKAAVEPPVLAAKTYTGARQTADVPASADWTVTANAGGVEPGAYQVTLTLVDADNTEWADGAAATRTLDWEILPGALTDDMVGVLTNADVLTYRTWNEQTVVVAPPLTEDDYDVSTEGADIGERVVTVTGLGDYAGTVTRVYTNRLVGTGTVSGPKTWKKGKTVRWKAKAAKGSVFSHWAGEIVDELGLSANALRNPTLAFKAPAATGGFAAPTATFIPIDDDGFDDLWLEWNGAAVDGDVVELAKGAAVENLWLRDDSLSYVKAKATGLPKGVSFNAKTLKFGGKPTVPGTSYVKIVASNASGYKRNAVFKMVVVGSGKAKNAKAVTVANKPYYPLTILSTVGGSTKGTGVYASNATVTVKAAASKGYVFAGWFAQLMKSDEDVLSGDEEGLLSKATSLKVKVPETRYLFARFVKKGKATDPVKRLACSSASAEKTLTLYQGVALDGADVIGCVSASRPKFTAQKLPTGVKLNATTGVLTGVPTKAGTFTTKVTAKNLSTSAKLTLKITVKALPSWAKGTYNGGTVAEGVAVRSRGLVTMTVGSTGKISGKWSEGGTNWTMKATSYAAYDVETGNYTANVALTYTYKKKVKGKTKTYTVKGGVLTVEVGPASWVPEGAASDWANAAGVATAENEDGKTIFVAARNLWGTASWKKYGTSLFGKKGKTLTIASAEWGLGEGESVTLTVKPSGAVTAKGRFATGVANPPWYAPTCSSAVAVWGAPNYEAFTGSIHVYFAPNAAKGLEDGWVDTVPVTAEDFR